MPLLPRAALEHGRVAAVAGAELDPEGFEMLGAVGEDEDVASPPVRVGDIVTDLAGALRVGGNQAEDGLDPGVLGRVGVGEGIDLKGWCQLMGLSPLGLFPACACVVVNFEPIDAFESHPAEAARRAASGTPIQRRQRRRRRTTLAELVASNRPPP